MEQFVIRAYGFNELARLYFPDVAPKTATNQLRQWLKSQQIQEKLNQAGYSPGKKIFSPKQVSIIVDELGEPFSSLL